jgi:hypothetical protein
MENAITFSAKQLCDKGLLTATAAHGHLNFALSFREVNGANAHPTPEQSLW